jgi:drug/metabolite transporter (DMT)-like permease
MVQERQPLDLTAYSVTLLLTLLWGLQHVAIKAIIADVSPVTQAAIRFFLAGLLLFAWARWQRIPLFRRDGTLWAGLLAGLLFALEFVLIYGGLALTNASRMSVFVYLTPPLAALGLHFAVPQERLRWRQWIGVWLAFAGLALAFGEGFLAGGGMWLGDLCGLGAAVLWAATIVLIRATSLARATATKALLYQVGVSIIVLPLAAWAMGERGVVALTPAVVASLAYQTLVIAFASFLAWFWLMTRYRVGPLAVMLFATPLFGVLAGVLFLGDPLTLVLFAAAGLVACGIALVNWPRRSS